MISFAHLIKYPRQLNVCQFRGSVLPKRKLNDSQVMHRTMKIPNNIRRSQVTVITQCVHAINVSFLGLEMA